jgi:scyllo-inositol 2-dehydrogenase (NADP+)
MSMQLIRVALIGYGLAGETFHAPLLTADPAFQLRLIVTRRAEAVARGGTGAGVVADPAQVFTDPDVDLVVIATPNNTHASLAERALAAGKHVVVDKPFTVTSAEATHLIALAERQHLCLSVFHSRRWDGDFLTVQKLLAEERLGRLYTFESHYDRFRPEVRARWKEEGDPGAGTLYDLGAHIIDQALTLFGMPASVLADLGRQRPGARSTDYVHLSLSYGELRVLLHSGSVVSGPWPRFVLQGDKGSYHKRGMDPQEDQLMAGLRPGHPDFGREPEERHGELSSGERVPTLAGRYHAFYQALAQALTGGGPPPVTAESAASVIRVIEAAEQSAALGRRVEL